MIAMIDMDVLEQGWLPQLGLAAAGGPHDDGGEVGERPAAGEAGRALRDGVCVGRGQKIPVPQNRKS